MMFYGNIYSGQVSNPYGELKGLKKNLKRLGYVQLTGINGQRDLILKRFNYEKKIWEFVVLKKRERNLANYYIQQGFEIEKDYNEKITRSEIEAELENLEQIKEALKEEKEETVDTYFPNEERKEHILKKFRNFEKYE